MEMLMFNVKSSVESKTNQSQTTSKYLQLYSASKMVSRCLGFFFISVGVITVDVILNLPELTFCCVVAQPVYGGLVTVVEKKM